jgi:hypothetical protein
MNLPRRKIRIGATLLLTVLVLVGCMVSENDRARLAPPQAVATADRYDAPAPAIPEAESILEEGFLPERATGADVPLEPAGEDGRNDPAPRLRVFSATLELSVASVDRAREQIIALVDDAGGYIETAHQDFLVVRVPASGFEAALERIGQTGDVLSRSIESADVTEQFADLERRLEIARTARERLYELLERTNDSDEQVAILREIRRLTEEIEQLAGRLESLGRLVEYSRITVSLYPRLAGEDVLFESIPFPWIAALNPLAPTIGRARRSFAGELPSDFARFSEGREIRAESADGVRVRVGGRENDPEGDAAFWREALVFHRGPLYAEAVPFEAGRFLGVAFTSRDATPFVYWVLVAVRTSELVVAEVFFPSDSALERHRTVLLHWIEEVLP